MYTTRRCIEWLFLQRYNYGPKQVLETNVREKNVVHVLKMFYFFYFKQIKKKQHFSGKYCVYTETARAFGVNTNDILSSYVKKFLLVCIKLLKAPKCVLSTYELTVKKLLFSFFFLFIHESVKMFKYSNITFKFQLKTILHSL